MTVVVVQCVGIAGMSMPGVVGCVVVVVVGAVVVVIVVSVIVFICTCPLLLYANILFIVFDVCMLPLWLRSVLLLMYRCHGVCCVVYIHCHCGCGCVDCC